MLEVACPLCCSCCCCRWGHAARQPSSSGRSTKYLLGGEMEIPEVRSVRLASHQLQHMLITKPDNSWRRPKEDEPAPLYCSKNSITAIRMCVNAVVPCLSHEVQLAAQYNWLQSMSCLLTVRMPHSPTQNNLHGFCLTLRNTQVFRWRAWGCCQGQAARWQGGRTIA
jgi:hypothetical protein